MIYSEREKGGFARVTVTAANFDCRLMIDIRAKVEGILRLMCGELFPTKASSFLGITD